MKNELPHAVTTVTQPRVEAADGIRGLACLLVLAVHAVAIFFQTTLPYLAGCGKFGVWLFFVLSAFLLTIRFERNGFAPRELLAYGVSRFLRIIPLFALAVWLYWRFGTAGIVGDQAALAALFFRQGFAHLWTIPVEFKFYAVLPVFAFALLSVRRRYGRDAVIWLSVVATILHQLCWPHAQTPESSIDTHWYLPTFLAGCVAAVCRPPGKWVSDRTADAVGIAVLVGIWFTSASVRHFLFGTPADRWPMDKYIYFGVAWALFVYVLADGRGCIGRMLRWKVFARAGAWSYSAYLIHWFFYMKLATAYPESIAWMLIAMVATMVSAWALHALVERPIDVVRHGLEKWIKGDAATRLPVPGMNAAGELPVRN